MNIKKCRKCLTEKSLLDFHKSKRHRDGVKNECAICTNFYLKEKYNNGTKEKHKVKNRNNHYKRKYGITYEEYIILFNERLGKCDICQKVCNAVGSTGSDIANVLVIDHCHLTNRLRGMLCQTCNQGIGMFKDNIDLLTYAHLYLLNDSNMKDVL